jgi:hypothetical protein
VKSIEVVDDTAGRVTRGPRDQVRKLTEAQMAQAFAAAEALAGQAGAMLARLRDRPEQRRLSGMEIEFGLSFNTELTVYVVSATADASLSIKLTWSAAAQE